MEILNNFISIYCLISFIVGEMFMLVILAIVVMGKDNDEPRNKVHFYVTCELNSSSEIIHTRWIGKPYYTEYRRFRSSVYGRSLAVNASFALYNLNYSNFTDMKEGEIREVFINLED